MAHGWPARLGDHPCASWLKALLEVEGHAMAEGQAQVLHVL
jgi:hypothetical protein